MNAVLSAVVVPVNPMPINRRVITGSVMLSTIIQALDTTIANVALPHV